MITSIPTDRAPAEYYAAELPPTPALRIVESYGNNEGNVYARSFTRFEVYAGDEYLTTHYSRRNARAHLAGKPVLVNAGPRVEVWVGTHCESFKGAQAALDHISTLLRKDKR